MSWLQKTDPEMFSIIQKETARQERRPVTPMAQAGRGVQIDMTSPHRLRRQYFIMIGAVRQ